MQKLQHVQNRAELCTKKYIRIESVPFFAICNISRRVTAFTFWHIQTTRACPFCGFKVCSPEGLRTHIELCHESLLKLHGPQVVNRKIFWRAKRGVRRIPQEQVDAVLARHQKLKRVRKPCLKFLQSVLKLCLVEINNDKLCI